MMGKAHGLEIFLKCGARLHINALFLAPYFWKCPQFLACWFFEGGLYLSLGPMLLCLNEQNLLKWHGIPAGLSVSPLISEVASMHFGGAVVHVAVARLVFHKSFRLFFFFFSLVVCWLAG